MLTQQRLKEVLHYNPKTGVFTWIKNSNIASSKSPHGYLRVYVDGTSFYQHRLAWFYVNGCWPENEIDHINGVRTDNRINNIRLATRSENEMNTKMRSDNSSGVKGVSWYASRGRWVAEIRLQGKNIWLGQFEELKDAENAIRKARPKIHDKFHKHG
jgi:hypothetical protein